jgi:AcrR family transcriptional regulator
MDAGGEPEPTTSAESRPRSVGHGRGGADPSGRILQAARVLFFREGFARVTFDRLAREAGVSKSTIYKYFGDMPGVLRAVAEREADHVDFDGPGAPASAEAFATHLVATGTALLDLVSQPDKLQFDRLVLEQARSYPDLAEIYYDAIYQRAQEHLARVLADGQRGGFLRRDADPGVLADQLLSMWLGLAATRARLGIQGRETLTSQERSQEAVATMMGFA